VKIVKGNKQILKEQGLNNQAEGFNLGRKALKRNPYKEI